MTEQFDNNISHVKTIGSDGEIIIEQLLMGVESSVNMLSIIGNDYNKNRLTIFGVNSPAGPAGIIYRIMCTAPFFDNIGREDISVELFKIFIKLSNMGVKYKRFNTYKEAQNWLFFNENANHKLANNLISTNLSSMDNLVPINFTNLSPMDNLVPFNSTNLSSMGNLIPFNSTNLSSMGNLIPFNSTNLESMDNFIPIDSTTLSTILQLEQIDILLKRKNNIEQLLKILS